MFGVVDWWWMRWAGDDAPVPWNRAYYLECAAGVGRIGDGEKEEEEEVGIQALVGCCAVRRRKGHCGNFEAVGSENRVAAVDLE